jgi:hypothetical protein
MSIALAPEKVEQDPKLSLEIEDDDDMDLSKTPAADLLENGLAGLVMALNLCPEAAASGKRTKQIHKKGELGIEGAHLKLKWNVDYKGGSVLNLRVVTLKEVELAAGAGAGAGAVSDGEGMTAPPAPAAGRKRARKEPTKPEDLDLRTLLQQAYEGCVAQNKVIEAEELQKLIEKL